LEERTKIFKHRRNFMVEKLNSAPGLSVSIPQGAFYLFASCESLLGKSTKSGKLINNYLDFTEYLLEDHLVAVVPGIAFGLKNFIRISYAASQDQLEIGCNSIIKACQDIYYISLKLYDKSNNFTPENEFIVQDCRNAEYVVSKSLSNKIAT